MNHIKIAWRNISKDKGYALLNILGLAIGLSAVLLIGLWIQNQFLYDNFYPHSNQIYKLWNRTEYKGDINMHSTTMGAAAPALKAGYPEVEQAARLYWSTTRLLTRGERKLKTAGNEVDPDFIAIFDFPLLYGSREHLLDQPDQIVLTESLAKKLFKEENPVGKTLLVDKDKIYRVSGVLKDLPAYTDFDFSYLIPLGPEAIKNYGETWNSNTYYTFVRLKTGSDIEALNRRLEPLVRKNQPELKYTSVFLFPMGKMHLYSEFTNGQPSGGIIDQVRMVGAIGLLILLIACINFINLTTARSHKRSREIGVRKVVGASKGNLMLQFLSESIVLACIAGLLAIIISTSALPWLNRILDTPLVLDWTNPIIWIIGWGFILLTGLLAGIYPAFALSAFRPIHNLKTRLQQPRQVFKLRETLVVFQFGIAIFLIVTTLVIRLQIDYAGQRAVGYHTAQLLQIPVEGDINQNYQAIKNELIRQGWASEITRTGWDITVIGASSGGGISWEGSTPEQELQSSFILARTESDFIKTLGLELSAGRDIDFARSPADSTAVLLNQAAVKSMGLNNPIGKYLTWGDETYTIVGVFNDYVLGSPYQDIQPMLVYPSHNSLLNMVIRSNPAHTLSENLKGIEKVLKTFNPEYPFSYSFVDESFAEKFHEQQQIGNLALLFSILAIFISCLGLFGLASYVAETRTKEIGIRKVLGASVQGITHMLSRDFIKLIGIALLLASPVAWWAMNHWLNDFSYRIQMHWWMLLLAGLLALCIGLLSVGWQAIRAARSNPVDALRSE